MQKDIKRGCGKRVAGGAYIVTEVGRTGVPLDSFLFDPPWVPVDKNDNPHYPGAVGLHPVENPFKKGVVDLWDWIGESYYPFFPDFWEETRRYGLSRRISASADFDLLSTESSLIGFHPKGLLLGTDTLYNDLAAEQEYGTGMDECPQNLEHDSPEDRFCIRYSWQLVDTDTNIDNERLFERPMPVNGGSQFSYMAAHIPWWINEKRYMSSWQPAAMFFLPIHRIEVVADPVEGLHDKVLDTLETSITTLPFILVTE